MIRNMDALIDKVDSRYTLVILAAKRARDINNYLNGLQRGELTHVRGPQIDMIGEKALTIAFEEIDEDKITYERSAEGIK